MQLSLRWHRQPFARDPVETVDLSSGAYRGPQWPLRKPRIFGSQDCGVVRYFYLRTEKNYSTSVHYFAFVIVAIEPKSILLVPTVLAIA